MIFSKSLAAWNTPAFAEVFKQELRQCDSRLLPLQDGLTQSSYVSASPINPVVLTTTETPNAIRIKTGIFYAGIIAGSCCADDPGPVCEQTEYCELQIDIDKHSAQASCVLLGN